MAAPKTLRLDARERLVLAASRAFARHGLKGATTREIAREAGVNEVTLFRHFQNKENLLSIVLERTFPDRADGGADAGGPGPADLRAELQRYAEHYHRLLERNVLLVRTLLGEIHHHRAHESHVLQCIFAPIKAAIVHTLETARDRGAIRAEIDPVIAADLFGSTILVEVLRRSSSLAPVYDTARYLEAAVDVLARGMEMPGPSAK